MNAVCSCVFSVVDFKLAREREREDAAVKTKGAKVTVRQRKVVVWN